MLHLFIKRYFQKEFTFEFLYQSIYIVKPAERVTAWVEGMPK